MKRSIGRSDRLMAAKDTSVASMRERLKDVTHSLTNPFVLIVTLIYTLNAWEKSRERNKRVNGLLTLTIAEVGRHQRMFDNLVREPQRLFEKSNKSLAIAVWDHSRAELAQLLWIEDFLFIDAYYENVEAVNEEIQHVVSQGARKVEELRASMEVYVYHAGRISVLLRRYLTNIPTEGSGK